jgi:flagellar basal-body rod modification protein FlgD
MQIFPDTSGIGAAAATAAQAQDTTGTTSGTGASTTNTATVTANDFLQLLVAEMKNQDPTANTDPNEYINQLVQVNSLQQLMQINQDLGGGTTSSTGTSGDVTAPGGVAANQPAGAVSGGNLSAGDPGNTASAATRVASALGAATNQANPLTPNAAGTGTGNPFETFAAAMHRRAPAAPTTTTSPAR